MKALIISDLHGNYEALSALPESYDELWVLDDLVNYGPEPSAVADFVQNRATFAIRGNHDHAVGYSKDPRCTPRYAVMAAATQKLSEAQLTVKQLEFLHDLPAHEEFERDTKRVYCCHAKPTNPDPAALGAQWRFSPLIVFFLGAPQRRISTSYCPRWHPLSPGPHDSSPSPDTAWLTQGVSKN